MKLRPTARLKLRHRDAGITLLNAMSDPVLFGPYFKEQHTWRAWRVFLRALFGLPMTASDRETFQRHTGRSKAPQAQAREGWLVVGRRGGKSFIVALIAVFLACFREYRRYLAPGERATVMVLAADRKQARVVMRYARALLEKVPMLARMVERFGMESIDLNNHVTLEIHTASFRSVRGYSIAAAILDEVAFWRSEDSANPDSEIVAALLPAMTTIPGSLLLGISSPYARRGVLWERFQQHYGHEGDVLIWKADSRSMNPTIPEGVIQRAYENDPTAAAAEYGAEFRSDVAGFLDDELIERAVASGVYEITPRGDCAYRAFVDPSGGKHDSFTLAIAHSEDDRLVLDVCRGRRPPFTPGAVVAEYSHVLKQYGLSRVTGDRYSGEWVASAFREQGIHYEVSERTASDIYLEALPRFATGAIQLLDNLHLLGELRQLERITGRGKDIVDHPPRGHDDLAVAACGALLLAIQSVRLDLSTQALTISAAEQRFGRDEHLVDLGLTLGDDSTDSESPFEFDWRDT